MLRQYKAFDATGQQLIDAGFVLINGQREPAWTRRSRSHRRGEMMIGPPHAPDRSAVEGKHHNNRARGRPTDKLMTASFVHLTAKACAGRIVGHS